MSEFSIRITAAAFHVREALSVLMHGVPITPSCSDNSNIDGLSDADRRMLLKKSLLYRGVCSAVAEEIGKDLSHVRRVALGERRSRRIEAALIRKVRTLDKELAA